MCNNCKYKGIHVQTLPNISDNFQAENDELKKQVAALTQALETQNRENQPYIRDLKKKTDSNGIVIGFLIWGIVVLLIFLAFIVILLKTPIS